MTISKFEIILGLRFLRAKHKNGFVSFISLVSILGITLGVAALITVLSVMNGFQREIRTKIVGVTAHMQLTDMSGALSNWQQIATIAKAHDAEVQNYAPYVDGEALMSFDNNVSGVLVRGITPKYENQVDDIHSSLVAGSAATLVPDKFNIIIGYELAKELGVSVGDKITLITPNGAVTPTGMIPRLKQFTVSGIFNVHMYEYDSSLVLINLHDAQILFKMGDAVTGVRLKVANVMDTPNIKEHLAGFLPENVVISDWISQHQNYFAAVAMEKKMMFVILTLIIAVAAFNLVSTLVMTVNDKKSDIAILRTMGASKKSIMHIFMLQGGVAGIIGTISGTIIGLLLATYIGAIVHYIELLTGTKLISGDVYLIDYLPSQIMPRDVICIFVVSSLLSILATVYPSIAAAKTDPVQALRYE